MRAGKQSYRRATRAHIAERLSRVAELYRGGQTQTQIASELGLSTFTVSTDIGAQIAVWRSQAAVDIHARIAAELESIDRAEAQAYEAFEKSRLSKKISAASKRVDPSDPSRTVPGVVPQHLCLGAAASDRQARSATRSPVATTGPL